MLNALVYGKDQQNSYGWTFFLVNTIVHDCPTLLCWTYECCKSVKWRFTFFQSHSLKELHLTMVF